MVFHKKTLTTAAQLRCHRLGRRAGAHAPEAAHSEATGQLGALGDVSLSWFLGGSYNVGPPVDSVQLVNITTISLGFMVVITVVTTVRWGYKPTYNVWGPTLYKSVMGVPISKSPCLFQY